MGKRAEVQCQYGDLTRSQSTGYPIIFQEPSMGMRRRREKALTPATLSKLPTGTRRYGRIHRVVVAAQRLDSRRRWRARADRSTEHLPALSKVRGV